MITQLLDRTYTTGQMDAVQLAVGGITEHLEIAASGTHTTAITGAQQDAPATIFPNIQIQRGGISLIEAAGRDLFYLMAMRGEAQTPFTNTTADAGAHNVDLPLAFTFNLAGGHQYGGALDLTDGEQVNVVYTGTDAATGLGTAATAIASTVRTTQFHTGRGEGAGLEFFEPFVTSQRLDCSSAALKADEKILPKDFYLEGLLFRAIDNSAEPTAGRVDGLVRTLTVTLDGTPLAASIRWKQLREAYRRRAVGIAATAMPAGIAYMPLGDPRHPYNLMRIGPSSILKVSVDTSTGVDADLTAITPAASDNCIVTVVGWTPNKVMRARLGQAA